MKNIKIVATNKRISPYKSASPDILNIGVKILKNNRLYNTKNILLEFFIDYPTKWTHFYSNLCSGGSITLTPVCSPIININNCLGYVRATIDNEYYRSNLIRFNFISSIEDTNNQLIIFPEEIAIFENEFFDF